jgi:hypothetical protein
MRVHLIFASMLLCAARILAAQGSTPTAEEVVATMYTHDTLREAESGGYTGTREYVLENRLLNKMRRCWSGDLRRNRNEAL